MNTARVILSAATLIVLLPLLAAAEPPAPAEVAPAAGAAACGTSLTQSIFPALPALPGQPAEPIYAACDWTCADHCDDYFQSCASECPGFRGDPCLNDCRNGRISCYRGCGCL